MSIEPGRMRHHIVIQHRVALPDGQGGRSTVLTTVAEPWASIDTTNGSLGYKYARLYPDTTHLFTVRYDANIQPNGIVLLGTRHFEILSVQNVNELNKEMVLVTKEVAV